MRPPVNWFRRYVRRRGLRAKVAHRAREARRRLTRDEHTDLARLFAHRSSTLVVDGGANVGYEADWYLRHLPGADVHCFEPTPATFAVLERNLGGHDGVHLHRLALSDHVGTATLHVDQHTLGGGSNSLLTHSSRFLETEAHAAFEAVTVDTTTLDRFCAREGIEHVDVLKLDVEGAEVQVLRGAGELLARSAVDALDVEVRALADFDGQPLVHDVLTHLARLDYRLFGLYAVEESAIGQLQWANAVLLSAPFRAELRARHGATHTRF